MDAKQSGINLGNQQDLLLLVESIEDYAIYLLDHEGIITTWNKGAEKLKGYLSSEIIGKHFSTFYCRHDIESGKPVIELKEALANGRYEDEGWRIRKDGSRFWANVIVTPLFSENGEHRGFGKITRDLTERKQTHERFKLMIESVKDYAILMIDPSGHILTWNEGAERIKGYKEDEILGKHFSIFYPPEDVAAGKLEMEIKTAIETGRFEDYGWRVKKDGTKFWANVVITCLRDDNGEVIGFGKVTRDITDKKLLEEEREALIKKLESAVALRDEFLALASHELRTPLTSLALLIQSIPYTARKEKFTLPPYLIQKLKSADKQLHRFEKLVDSLLDVTKIAQQQFECEFNPVDLSEIIKDLIEHFTENSEASRSVTFKSPGPVFGCWDKLRLEQVMYNLLSNAFRYGDKKPVEIVLTGNAETATIKVIDQGKGMKQEELEKIFGRFEQGEASRIAGGLGLGLYIVKQVIHAHGGKIWVDSQVGQGTTFTIELPRNR